MTLQSGTAFIRTPSAVVRVSWASCTHTGNRRTLNEDAVCVAPPVFLVADGMGGHQSGEVASALAVGSMSALQSGSAVDSVVLGAAVHDTNRLIRAKSGGGARPMGTTLTGLAIAATRVPMAAVVNIGDSRTYLLEGERLVQVTTDHSHVQELIDRGMLAAEDARSHPERNVVTRALGVEPDVDADIALFPLATGQRWLACSDGLSGELDDEQIAQLASGPTAEGAAEALVAAVLAGAARDNVSVVIVDVVDLQPVDEEQTDPRWRDDTTQPNERPGADRVGSSVPSPWPPPDASDATREI